MKCDPFDKAKDSRHTTPIRTATSFTAFTSIFSRTTSATTVINMASIIKLSVFKGVGNEDSNQFWFVIRAIWEVQGVIDDNIKKVTLVGALQDHVLTWYIKHSNHNLNVEIADIQAVLNREFSKPKLEA